MLQADRVSKSYGSVRALQDVSITFEPGEIHAVLGENGAGKSTLMGVLAGFTRPDTGAVTLNGASLPLGRAFECKKRGIAMVHQHFTLVPEFTVLENLALTQVENLNHVLNLEELAAPALKIADELGWPIQRRGGGVPPPIAGSGIDLTARTSTLPVGAQQRLEILKNLAGDAKVVIFDEPTAVLSPDEVADLFRVLRRLRDSGKAVILIAHKLAEVMAIADRVTVLRHGKVVGGGKLAELTENQLATWMVGNLPEALSKPPQGSLITGLVIRDLRVNGDRGEERVRGLSLEVREGEIVGIGGVDGNGQVELAECLALVRPQVGGSMSWQGTPLTSHTKIGYIPQDRQTDGLALGLTIEENLLIEGRKRPDLTKGPLLLRRESRRWAERLRERFDIRAPSVRVLAGELSGGNQQKVVVSRVLDERPDLLIAVNPTRGLDLQASAFVHHQLLDAAKLGTAVLLISTDLDELAALADRTFFLSSGRLRESDSAANLVGGEA